MSVGLKNFKLVLIGILSPLSLKNIGWGIAALQCIGGFHLFLFPFNFPFIYFSITSIIALVHNTVELEWQSNEWMLSVQMSVRCTSKEIGPEDTSHFSSTSYQNILN